MAEYVPERGEVIWLDFEPTKGREIGKYRPALVPSPRQYNQTGLLICCQVSTSIRGSKAEVRITGLEQPSVVVASMVYTLAWRERKAEKIKTATVEEQHLVLQTLLPLLGVRELVTESAVK